MGAAAAGWGMKKLGFAVPGMVSKTAMLGGFGMGMLPGMAVSFVPQAIGTAASAIGNQLETSNIVMQSLGNRIGLGGPGGLGPSRAGLQQIGEATRELAKIPGLMTEVEELNSIMKKMTQAGMMQGARNISDFRQKFTQSINMLKDMSMVLGSTLEEAAGVAAELHKMGIVGAKDKLRLATGIQVGSMMGTGMAPELISQTVGSSLQMAQAMGGKSRIAASQGALQTIQSMTIANQMGLIDEQKVADLTGFTGEQGIASLAAMTQQKISGMMMNSGLGQAMTAAMSEVKDGKFTGKLDAELVERFKAGAISKEELARLGSQKLSGKNAGASFVRQRGTLSFNAAQAIGFEGVLNQIGSMVDEVGEGNEDLVAIVAKTFLDGDQGLADVLLKMSAQRRDISIKAKDDFRRGLETRMSAAVYKRDSTLGGRFAQFMHGMNTTFGSPIANAATGAQYEISQGLDVASRFITGAADTVSVSDYDARAARARVGRAEIALTPQQTAMATGNALQSLPSGVQDILKTKFKDPEKRDRLAREFSTLTTQKEREDFLKKELGIYGAQASHVLGAAAVGAVFGAGIFMGGSVYAMEEGAAARRRGEYGIETAMDQRMILSAAAQELAGGDKESAFSEFSNIMASKELDNDVRDEYASNIDSLMSGMFGMDTESFIAEGGEASRLYLTVLTKKGKLPDGTSISEFNRKGKAAKKKILMRQGFKINDDDMESLIRRFAEGGFATIAARADEGTQRLSDDAARMASELLADNAAKADALVQEDFQTLQYQLTASGNTDQAEAVRQFTAGNSGPLMSLLAGQSELTNPTLASARANVQALDSKRANLNKVSSEKELLAQLNLDSQLEGVSSIISDEGDSLSDAERTRLIAMAREAAVTGAIATTTSTEGLTGEQRMTVRDESLTEMVRANTEFVKTVSRETGNKNIGDQANRVVAASEPSGSGFKWPWE
jgi:hypothetical protein